MFGTFEPEAEKAIYGITTPVNSYNPVYLVFHDLIDMVKEMWKVRLSPKKRAHIFFN
jgi:hypothetical protein